ncbi:MAG: prepilin-type N-terminal cleavage/methylation domain-containing protein [bacterium]
METIRRTKGFTLIELLLAISISLFVITMVTTVAARGLRHNQSIKRDERLHADTLFLTEKLSFWIKQSKSVNIILSVDSDCAYPPCLKIRIPTDNPLIDTTKIIFRKDNNIYLDDNVLNGDEIEITNIGFTKMLRSVRLSFTAKAKNGEETLNITTTIAQRNAP